MDIIQQYAQAGYAMFPLAGKLPDVPKGFDWKLTPVDPDLCRVDFLGNYGVVVCPRLILDIDVKKGQPGKKSFLKLTADCNLNRGWEKETFVVKTGSGGFHIYLSLPEGFEGELEKSNKEYPGIEILHGTPNRGWYVVGPGSIHPDFNVAYTVVFGSPSKLLQIPDAILKVLKESKKVEDIGEQPKKDFVDDDPLNIERFIQALKDLPEVPLGNQRNSAYIAACRGRDLGVSRDKCIELLRTNYNGVKLIPAIQEEEVEQVTKDAYRYAKGKSGSLNVKAIFETVGVGESINIEKVAYDMSKGGVPLKTLNNAVNYLATIPQISEAFRFNIFSGSIEISSDAPWFKERGSMGGNICDEDIILLKYFLSKTIKVEFNQQILLEAIIVVSHKRHYHPVRNYLDSLKWDGIPRIDEWMIKYGGALDNVYIRDISRKSLCAAVKRVFDPGCDWHYVLILEGDQGIGKSTACRILGRNWGADMNLDPHAKDAIHMMLGKWIIELSEMTALKWADANALKSFLTRGKDIVRLSYERHAKDYKRQSIFIGTVNPEHVGYLNDITGNRRYWIAKFNGAVDLIGLENACDQLWAEARLVYKEEDLFLVGESDSLQKLETQARMPEDPMRINVVKWTNECPGVTEVTTETILSYIGVPIKSINKGDQSRVAQALVQMGWIKKIGRVSGIFTTSYVRPQREQIAEMMKEL